MTELRRFTVDPKVTVCLVCGVPRGTCEHTRRSDPETMTLSLPEYGPDAHVTLPYISVPKQNALKPQRLVQVFEDDMTTRIERVEAPPSNQFDPVHTGGEPSLFDSLKVAKRITERNTAWLKGYIVGSQNHFNSGVIRGAGILFAMFVVLGLIYGIGGVSVAELLGF